MPNIIITIKSCVECPHCSRSKGLLNRDMADVYTCYKINPWKRIDIILPIENKKPEVPDWCPIKEKE